MHKKNDAYGTCPNCKTIDWHKYKKKGIIFGANKEKYKVSLFKCKTCGRMFGFDLREETKNVNKEWENDIYKIKAEDFKAIKDFALAVGFLSDGNTTAYDLMCIHDGANKINGIIDKIENKRRRDSKDCN